MRRLRLPDSATEPEADGTMNAPSATRNLGPILEVLLTRLPRTGIVLEIASGTGQHIAALAAHRPDLRFQPTDLDPVRRKAIDARCRGLANVAPAIALDAGSDGWASGLSVEAVTVVNLFHLISEAEMAVFLDESARALVSGGLLAIYGPFLRGGVATSEGDARFDEELRGQDADIGYKDIETVVTVLDVLGMEPELVEMPANNLFVLARQGVDRPSLG
jgi:SAM-dependent methyltransferase